MFIGSRAMARVGRCRIVGDGQYLGIAGTMLQRRRVSSWLYVISQWKWLRGSEGDRPLSTGGRRGAEIPPGISIR